MIIDHIGMTVSDYDKSKQFFCRALAPHGWARHWAITCAAEE